MKQKVTKILYNLVKKVEKIDIQYFYWYKMIVFF